MQGANAHLLAPPLYPSGAPLGGLARLPLPATPPTASAAPRSLFCLLELLTAIHHQKEVVLVRDLSYHLPMEPGQIAALCLPVLLGKMVRIKACGEQFTDEHAAARAIEKTLLDEASSRMIIYHAEHVTPHGPSKP